MKQIDLRNGSVIEVLEDIMDLIRQGHGRLAIVFLDGLARELTSKRYYDVQERLSVPNVREGTKTITLPKDIVDVLEARSEEELAVSMQLWLCYMGYGEKSGCKCGHEEEDHGG